jgi:hypothetical protein
VIWRVNFMAEIVPGYMGIASVGGKTFRANSFNISPQQTMSYYNNIFGLNDSGNAFGKKDAPGSPIPTRTLGRPSVKSINCSCSWPATSNSSSVLSHEATTGDTITLAAGSYAGFTNDGTKNITITKASGVAVLPIITSAVTISSTGTTTITDLNISGTTITASAGTITLLNNKIAACLFAGIYTDTGGFKYLNTTYKTLNIVSQLAKIYPQFTKLIFDIENTDEPDRLKLISILLGSIETYFSDKVAIASISFDEIEKNKLSMSSLNGNSEVANMIKSVVGWDIALTLTEIQPEIIKISMRTRDSQKYDLAKIAVATKAGGGHKAAAGATLNMPLPQAKETILAIIKKLYPKINSNK